MLLSAHCTVGTEIGFQLKIPLDSNRNKLFGNPLRLRGFPNNLFLLFALQSLLIIFLLHTSKIYIYILCVWKFDEELGADLALF